MNIYVGEGKLYINERITGLQIDEAGRGTYDIKIYLGEEDITFTVKDKEQLEDITEVFKKALKAE